MSSAVQVHIVAGSCNCCRVGTVCDRIVVGIHHGRTGIGIAVGIPDTVEGTGTGIGDGYRVVIIIDVGIVGCADLDARAGARSCRRPVDDVVGDLLVVLVDGIDPIVCNRSAAEVADGVGAVFTYFVVLVVIHIRGCGVGKPGDPYAVVAVLDGVAVNLDVGIGTAGGGNRKLCNRG